MRKLFIALFIFAVYSLQPLSTINAQTDVGFTMSPTLVELDMEQGGSDTVETVIRATGEDVAIDFAIRDFEPGADGVPQIAGEGEVFENSITDWISEPSSIVASGNDNSVEYTINVPQDASNRTYYGLFIANSQNSQDQASSAIAQIILINIGDKVVSGNLSDTRIEGVDFSNGSSNAFIFADIANTGDYSFEPTTLEAVVTNSSNQTVATIEPERTGRVLPESFRTFSFTMDENLPLNDTYSVQIRYSLNGEEANLSQKQVIYQNPVSASAIGEQDDESSNILMMAVIAAALFLAIIAILIAFKQRSRKNFT